MLSKVKIYWPVAAFAVAAVVLVAFLKAQSSTVGKPTEDELRKMRYENLLESARSNFNKSDYYGAADDYTNIEKNYSDLADPDVELEIARAVYMVYPRSSQRINSHLGAFFKRYEGTPKARLGYALRGEMLVLDGEYKEALDYLNRAIEGVPEGKEHARTYMAMGRAYYELRDDVNAERKLNLVIEHSVYPRDIAFANFLLGEINARFFVRSRDDKLAEKALDCFKRNQNASTYPDLCYASLVRMGDVLVDLHRFDEARDAYLSALEAAPTLDQMRQFLAGGDDADKDALLRLQIIGSYPKTAGDPTRATKLERVVSEYTRMDKDGDAARLLCRIAPFLKDRHAEYLRAAALFERCALRLSIEIDEEKQEIARLEAHLLGTIDNDSLVNKRKIVADMEEARSGYLRLAAEHYEKSYDAAPYADDADETPATNRLWKAASLNMERGALADSERILRRILSPRQVVEPVLEMNVRIALGDIFRMSGRYNDALAMFKAVRAGRMGPDAKGYADFLGKAALREALTLIDAGRPAEAETVLKDILRDDNEMGVGLYSKVWWEATFALGGIYYLRALSAETGRMQALIQAADLLRDAVVRYRTLAEPETIYKATFYLADSLHQAAIEAVLSEQKSRALPLFREARQFFEQVMNFDTSRFDASPLYYRNSRLLYADTFFFDARLSDDEAHRQQMYDRAIQEYSSVADSLHGTEQGAWALVQMGKVYQMLGKMSEAERQFDKAASAIRKLKDVAEEMGNNPADFDQAYFEKLLKWFRERNS